MAHSTSFSLDPDFLLPYQTMTAPFGFNGLGELVYRRTYSRLKPDGTQEAWWETVRRVVEGVYTMQRRWITSHHLGWSSRKAQRSAQEMYDRMFHMKFLPPGRGLWAMGSPLTESKGLSAALFNCAFISTKDIAVDLTEPFTFLMDASMLGIGVGFDTRGEGQLVLQAPGAPTGAVTVIPDSREGWVDSVRTLLEAFFVGTPLPQFDYSAIRPAGEPIRGFGGVAAGPGPLRDLHAAITDRLQADVGQPLSATAIVDVMNRIGQCVVAGNLRRSALIAFGEADDAAYLDLKNYEVNPHRASFGWVSNNSVFATATTDYAALSTRIADNGEPGLVWLDNMQAYGRMADAPDYADHRVRGTNPCGEIPLEHGELCNLVETFPARHDSLADFLRTLKFAYLYAKTVTLSTTPWTRSNQVMLRNRRIGVSQSGVQQAVVKLGLETYREWCDRGYQTLRHYDQVYSDWLAIPRSIRMTTVKPSGTVSLLAGATPGMHWPEARTYVRRMRIGAHSDLLPAIRAAGYPVEPAEHDPDNTMVVEIPVQIEDAVRTAAEVPVWEQVSMAAFLQRYWADNQVSCTATFDPVTEGGQLAGVLQHAQYQLKGISFLPRHPAGAYAQMPYEAISEAEYAARVAQLTPLAIDRSQEEAEQERYCDGDRCVLA